MSPTYFSYDCTDYTTSPGTDGNSVAVHCTTFQVGPHPPYLLSRLNLSVSPHTSSHITYFLSQYVSQPPLLSSPCDNQVNILPLFIAILIYLTHISTYPLNPSSHNPPSSPLSSVPPSSSLSPVPPPPCPTHLVMTRSRPYLSFSRALCVI